MSLLLLVPSRGRPQNAKDTLNAFVQSRTLDSTRILFVVDSDDPTFQDYPTYWCHVVDPPPGSMNAALNKAALDEDVVKDASVVGFIGDDHRPRTLGWDEAILGILTEDGPGVAYANDLHQGERLPTTWFVTREIVDEFGMGLPGLRHLFIDNYWLDLAGGADCLFYLPDIVIEHVHPHAQKAAWDENYARVNAPAMYEHDGAIYRSWRDEQMASDVEKLRGIIGE